MKPENSKEYLGQPFMSCYNPTKYPVGSIQVYLGNLPLKAKLSRVHFANQSLPMAVLAEISTLARVVFQLKGFDFPGHGLSSL